MSTSRATTPTGSVRTEEHGDRDATPAPTAAETVHALPGRGVVNSWIAPEGGDEAKASSPASANTTTSPVTAFADRPGVGVGVGATRPQADFRRTFRHTGPTIDTSRIAPAHNIRANNLHGIITELQAARSGVNIYLTERQASVLLQHLQPPAEDSAPSMQTMDGVDGLRPAAPVSLGAPDLSGIIQPRRTDEGCCAQTTCPTAWAGFTSLFTVLGGGLGAGGISGAATNWTFAPAELAKTGAAVGGPLGALGCCIGSTLVVWLCHSQKWCCFSLGTPVHAERAGAGHGGRGSAVVPAMPDTAGEAKPHEV
jgi:hypothetical protein